jgi:hypothetical protein
MEIGTQELLNILGGDCPDDSEFRLYQEDPWISEGKYESRFVILVHTPTGKFYEFQESRSGSYFTEYQYWHEWQPGDTVTLSEVKPVETITITWESVG